MYSDSVVEVVTMTCFPERHEMVAGPSRKMYPEKDRLVSRACCEVGIGEAFKVTIGFRLIGKRVSNPGFRRDSARRVWPPADEFHSGTS